MSLFFVAHGLQDLPDIAKSILKNASSRNFLFYGEMGVGKTTLIKALSLQLGVVDIVSSPTFSIINEYNLLNDKIYHFDLYRLESEQEALDIGYDDYFSSGDYCFVEWPERISNIIEDDVVVVHMSLEGNKRVIELVF